MGTEIRVAAALLFLSSGLFGCASARRESKVENRLENRSETNPTGETSSWGLSVSSEAAPSALLGSGEGLAPRGESFRIVRASPEAGKVIAVSEELRWEAPMMKVASASKADLQPGRVIYYRPTEEEDSLVSARAGTWRKGTIAQVEEFLGRLRLEDGTSLKVPRPLLVAPR